jgi:hypothetical protein
MYMLASASTGVYEAEVAPVMSANGPAAESAFIHCQLWSVTLPSESTTSPASASPTMAGPVVTVPGSSTPGSSTLATVTVTSRVSMLVPSEAFTVTMYTLLVSASAAFS